MKILNRVSIQSSRVFLLILSLCSSALLLMPATALAQLPACTPPTGNTVDEIVGSLQTQMRNNCYGESRDNSELKLWFDRQLTEAEIPDQGDLQESHLQAVEAIMQRLSSTVRSHAADFENANRPGSLALRTVANRLASETPSQTSGPSPGTIIDDNDGGWRLDFEEDRYGPDANDRPMFSPKLDLLQPNCQAQTDTDDCRAAVVALVDLVRVANLMQSVHQRADRSLGVNLLAYQRAEVMWDLYTNEARVQYPWEMVVNGALYQRDINELEAEQGYELALVDRLPPDRQIILLHPGVGLEYVDDATDGGHPEPAVVMEWLGFNTWRYRGSGSDVTMARPLGVSLVTTLSDRDGGKSVGHGLAFHWNHTMTTGVTWRSGGEVGLFISIGLADRFSSEQGRLSRIKDIFGALRP